MNKGLLTEKDLPWLYNFTVTRGNIDTILEYQLAKIRGVIESHNSIDYPYGADFKQAILKAIGGGELPDICKCGELICNPKEKEEHKCDETN